jgi:integrase
MRGYVSIVENHVRPALGTKRLDRLKPLDVRLLIDAKLESGLSPTSVAHVLRLLRNALGEAERMDLVVRNVAKAVAMPSALSPQPYTLTIQDVRALLAEASGHRLHAFFATQMLLGLRRGEGLGLRWADIDLDTGSVQIRGSLQRVDGHLQLVPPKTRASRAEIVAPAGLLEILRKHRAGQLAERMAAGEAWPGGDFVFTSTRGTPLEPRNVNRAWDLVRTAAGLPQVRLHDLRHGYATVLTAIGVQPRVVMQMLRHANIAITMDTYAHVGLETQREAARSLDRALFGRD